MAKEWMIDALGEDHLLLPGLIGAALAANDRVKYLLTLLQSARACADGTGGPTSLREERLASGIDDIALDRVVSESTRQPDGAYRIPGAQALARRAVAELETMLAPLAAAGVPASARLAERAEAVAQALSVRGDVIAGHDVTLLCAGRGYDGDSLHVLVMDAHRELNALQARIATDTIAGARVHDLGPGDGDLVAAFMRGIQRTERVKFDHPGLGTLATRTGPALVLQNDLGTTDAHVVVIRVTGLAVTMTYTDVHLQRLLFFQDLLSAWGIAWEDTRSHNDPAIEGGMYHLASARYDAGDAGELMGFLEDLGSHLVFIIDWNRARKRLRRLVGRGAAVDVLRWAADRGYGHIAFLRAGADGLVYDALEFAGGRAVRAGESLKDVLGATAAERYLKAVMRICAEGLMAGQPVSLVQDEVRAELTGYLRSAREEVHGLAVRHAELSVEIAEAAGETLQQAILGSEDRRQASAARARATEHEADELVTEARSAAARSAEVDPLLALIEAADDIADSVEEAAFYATLLPPGHPTAAARPQVRRIAQLVLSASREYLRAVQLSVDLRRGAPREEMDAFLAATHRTIELEHETDETQRAVHQALVTGAGETGPGLFVVVELTRAYEEAADALMHAAHLLREHTLARVVRSEASARRSSETGAGRSFVPAPAPAGDAVYLIGDPAVAVPDALTIGGKAHGLARVARAGLRVPEAAVLKTSLARAQLRSPDTERLREILDGAVDALEARTGLRVGSPRRPLLLSVRSGAPVSMPGMLETVLNVGMCDVSARGMIALTGNPRLAWDCYRRLVESFASVVHGLPHEPFARALQDRIDRAGAQSPRELPARVLEELTRDHLDRFARLTGRPFPQDPREQLLAACAAVIRSWDGAKAREYRHLNAIPDDLGTAVIMQRMVFGNSGGLSGAGVGFTRDPALGDARLYMDFLFGAQGEDVVAGRRTAEGAAELSALAPAVLDEIERACPQLESEFRDAQEFELTLQDGELFLLQARTAKRTAWAALRIATDQVREGLISKEVGLQRLDGIDLDRIRRVRVDVAGAAAPLARAIPAGVGVATGPIALDGPAAARIAAQGTPPVLVRAHTITEDIAAVEVSAGLLTAAGGRTSHAAVVARELGKPCLVGCPEMELDLEARTVSIGGQVFAEGGVICLDAESGMVYAGAPAVIEERPEEQLAELTAWRDRRLAPSGGQ
ncbi:MAG: DUF47 family protein [Solirubrobacteraceae bacterium]